MGWWLHPIVWQRQLPEVTRLKNMEDNFGKAAKRVDPLRELTGAWWPCSSLQRHKLGLPFINMCNPNNLDSPSHWVIKAFFFILVPKVQISLLFYFFTCGTHLPDFPWSSSGESKSGFLRRNPSCLHLALTSWWMFSRICWGCPSSFAWSDFHNLYGLTRIGIWWCQHVLH